MLGQDCCADDCQFYAVAVPGPPGRPGDGSPVYGESPSGARDGVNLVFALSAPPSGGTAAVYRNGLREVQGIGFTLSGSTLIFTSAPLSDDVLTVDYLIGP